MNLTRRNVLRGLLAGSAFAGASLIGVRGPSRMAAPGHIARLPPAVGTFERLKYALLNNRRIVLGGTEAWADEPIEPVIVHIKVMNQMHAPMLFALGQENAETRQVTRGGRSWAQKAASSADMLLNAGIERTHPDPRFRKLRFTEWFAEMLKTGLAGGQTLEAASGRTGEFPPESQVSIHGFTGIDSNVTHTYNNFLLPEAAASSGAGGDLLFHAVTTGLVRPPLGITCFNMGGEKENTGGLPANSVLNGSRSVVASGRSVRDMTSVLRAAITTGLVDDDLVKLFDAVGQEGFPEERKSTLRQALFDNRAKLDAALAGFDQVANLEDVTQGIGPGNAQGGRNAGTAKSEFLAQCVWVDQALSIPGLPLRAFCLDLHVADIDGQPFDSGDAPSAAGPALSYVESMRQLAVGLNILARTVARTQAMGGHVYVVVSTEGGRDEGGGDSVAPSGIILAPGTGAANGLADGFYAPQGAFDGSDQQWLNDPSSRPRAWVAGNLVNFAGVQQSVAATNGDIFHGVLYHLARVRGASDTTTSAFGNRLKFNGA